MLCVQVRGDEQRQGGRSAAGGAAGGRKRRTRSGPPAQRPWEGLLLPSPPTGQRFANRLLQLWTIPRSLRPYNAPAIIMAAAPAQPRSGASPGRSLGAEWREGPCCRLSRRRRPLFHPHSPPSADHNRTMSTMSEDAQRFACPLCDKQFARREPALARLSV